MSAILATAGCQPAVRRLHDRVSSLERLCRRVSGQTSAAAAAGTPPGRATISSGLPSLDRLLPQGGVRLGSLIEWLEPAAETGIETAAGAAAFALAVAVRLQTSDSLPAGRPIVIVDRSGRFYPPAVLPWLEAARRAVSRESTRVAGQQPSAGRRRQRPSGSGPRQRHRRPERADPTADCRLYVVRPDSEADELWAIDQSLRCPGVAAVVGWPQRVAATPLRRWQLAARSSGVIGLFVRPAVTRHEPTWSDVRVQVQPAAPLQSSSGRLFSGGWPDGPAGWIDVRAYRLERVGGGWESATAVAEPAVDCLLDLTCGRERPRSAGVLSQPAWRTAACRAS